MPMTPLLPGTTPAPRAVKHYDGFGSPVREEMSFRDVSRVLRRRSRLILSLAGAGLLLALLISLFMTPKFSSVAQVELNQADGNKLGLSDFDPSLGGSADDLGTDLSTLEQMLHSDSLAIETIQQNDLEAIKPYRAPNTAEFAAEASLPLASAPKRRTRAIKLFESNLKIKPIPGTRLLEVSFADPDAKRSAAVVNSLIANYTSDYIRRHYSNASQASEWLQKQVGDLKQQVRDSDKKVTEFEQKNGFFGYVGTGTDNTPSPLLQKLVALNQSVVQAQSERIQKEAVVKLLSTHDPELIVGLGSNPQVLNGVTGTDLAVLQNLRLQEAQVKSQYSEMETRYGPHYPTLVETRNQLASIQSSIKRSVDNLRSRAQNDYMIAAKNEAMLEQAFNQQVLEANRLNDKATQFQLLNKEAEANRNLYETLVTKLREADVAASVHGANITVVDGALPMPKPSKPNYPVNLAIGLGSGLLFGLGAAFYRSRGDQTLETMEVMEALSPAPILGAVPSLRRLKQSAAPNILDGITGKDVFRSQGGGNEDMLASEAYRRIRSTILLAAAGASPYSILVTSPLNGDGKSNTVLELATTFANGGARVLAMDCDLRRRGADEETGQANHKGLSDLLLDGGDPAGYTQPHHSVKNLSLLSSGRSIDSPLVLLESQRFQEILHNLKKTYDLILIDSPPVSFFADVSVIAQAVDATVLVVRAGVTSRQAFSRSCQTVLDAGGNLLGVIVNDLALNSADFYSYYGYRGKDVARSYAKV